MCVCVCVRTVGVIIAHILRPANRSERSRLCVQRRSEFGRRIVKRNFSLRRFDDGHLAAVAAFPVVVIAVIIAVRYIRIPLRLFREKRNDLLRLLALVVVRCGFDSVRLCVCVCACVCVASTRAREPSRVCGADCVYSVAVALSGQVCVVQWWCVARAE